MSDRPARTVFLGSGRFAVPIVAALAEDSSVELVGIVTAPPRPVGRRQELQPTPVGQWAVEAGQPTLSPTRLRDPEGQAEVAHLRPDLLVLADYGQLVPVGLLELPRHGALNLHPSLLPRHRGAAPVQAAIAAGDAQTGVTLMLMDAGLDSGPIVAQRTVTLAGSETAPELEDRLAQLAAEVLRDTLEAWLAGSLTARPQPADGVTMTRPLRREDGRLDPGRPALELERRVRAHQPWPGSFVETGLGRLIVWRARLLPAAEGAAGDAGELIGLPAGGLALVTADGHLQLLEVQPAGGRRMSAAELVRGRPAWVGARVAGAPAAGSVS